MTKTRKLAFVLLTLILSLIFLGGLIAGVEIFYRNWMPPSSIPTRNQIADSVLKHTFNNKTEAIPTHIPILLPKPIRAPLPFRPRPNFSPRYYEKDYYSHDNSIGIFPRANGIYRSRETTLDGKTVYDIQYTIDPYHRRVTVGPNCNRCDESLLLFGCSFTYGEGLPDSETLASQVFKRVSHFRPYTYAFHGWGPGNLLRWASKADFGKGIAEKKGKAVYVFIDSHMDRVVGNLSLTQAVSTWRRILPYYYLDSSGKLESQGMLSDGRPFETWLFDWLSRSAFLKYYKTDLPFQFTDQHFTLFASVIYELKKKVMEKTGVQDLYVVIYPGSNLGKTLIPYLDRLGIPSLDYSDVVLAQYMENITLPDGHPSAEANQFMAEQLIRDLHLN